MTQELAVTRSPWWHAELCEETATEIFERLRDLLEGGFHTLVVCNSYSETDENFRSVEVYPSQRITSPFAKREPTSDSFRVSIGWQCDRFVMGISTDAKTRREGRDGRPHKYVSVSFDGRSVTIDHYAPAGYRLRWILAVEDHRDYDAEGSR